MIQYVDSPDVTNEIREKLRAGLDEKSRQDEIYQVALERCYFAQNKAEFASALEDTHPVDRLALFESLATGAFDSEPSSWLAELEDKDPREIVSMLRDIDPELAEAYGMTWLEQQQRLVSLGLRPPPQSPLLALEDEDKKQPLLRRALTAAKRLIMR